MNTSASAIQRLRSPGRAGLFAALLMLTCLLSHGAVPKTRTENVFLIISDGLRWQEVFNGAEDALLSTNGGVKNVELLRNQFWRETPEQRREALFPFLWNVVGKHGQIFGNQTKGSVVKVTNGLKFSYPGYNEAFTGAPDPRIHSNDKEPNRNINVFEWLNGRPGFKKRVATFGTWDAFPYILNVERSGLLIWPAWEKKFEPHAIQPPPELVQMMRDTNVPWKDLVFDSWLQSTALPYVKNAKPRVAFLGFGETDEWAHDGRYDVYLQAAHHVDGFIQMFWETMQKMPQYRDKTTFIFTADHGRGVGPEWRNHGEKTQTSEGIFIAVIGPDTPSLGERTNCAPQTQSQIAATIAALLGENFRGTFPKAAPPINQVLSAR